MRTCGNDSGDPLASIHVEVRRKPEFPRPARASRAFLSGASVRSPADARGNVKLLHAVKKETRQDTSRYAARSRIDGDCIFL
jgi:hypothetical protein